MTDLILNFALVHTPWWVYLGIGVVVLLALAYIFHVPSRHLIWVGGLTLVAIFSSAIAARGYKAKEQQDMDEANKAIDRAEKARKKQEELNRDPKHTYDDDGFRRD
jgi:type VI protein secretion system component VasK